jgi:hypothetical protein
MGLTIEQAQKLSEFRVRFLQNARDGKRPEEGFSEEELTEGLAMLRQGKNSAAQAAAAAGKKGKGGGKKKKGLEAEGTAVKVDTSKFLGSMDLDDDEDEEEEKGAGTN